MITRRTLLSSEFTFDLLDSHSPLRIKLSSRSENFSGYQEIFRGSGDLQGIKRSCGVQDIFRGSGDLQGIMRSSRGQEIFRGSGDLPGIRRSSRSQGSFGGSVIFCLFERTAVSEAILYRKA